METLELGQVIGILGGGQLAKMLAEPLIRLGFIPRALTEFTSDPAAGICPGSVFGRLDDPSLLDRFLKQCDRVIFENEFVPCEQIARVAEGIYPHPQSRFFPSLETLFKLQDKLSQKKILKSLHIASAPYLEYFEDQQSISSWLEEVNRHYAGEFVIKWAQHGYDGYGNWISGPGRSLGQAKTFCERARDRGILLFAEQKIDFKQELAMVAVRSIQGDFKHYPLVQSIQESGICKWVLGPATSMGVPYALEVLAAEVAKALADHLHYVGAFAIEFFETQSGDLWVNEIAPRVHNSGHYSQNACQTSQFENHCRAVLGLPLGAVVAAPAFAMLNLLGPDLNFEEGRSPPIPQLGERSYLHWYGKVGMRKGRKLGHINAVARDAGEIPDLVRELQRTEVNWHKDLVDFKQRVRK
jgi:5-(carboxyamino)imidazole ribonucleotide synthase